jgi:hypothetical protein
MPTLGAPKVVKRAQRGNLMMATTASRTSSQFDLKR